MLDSLLKECFRRPLVGRLPSLIVVLAKKNRIDLRVILQHLPHHQIGHAAGCGIAVLPPPLLVQGDKGEHIVFNTLGLPSSATAIFFSAAPTVAHISLPPFCQRQSRRYGAYGSLYLHTSPTGGNLPPLPASRLTEHGGLVIGRNDLQKIPFVAAAVQAGASFRVFDQLELGRLPGGRPCTPSG